MTVTLSDDCNLSIPNIITPNSQGPSLNELFYVKNLEDFPNSSLVIYNRWGNKIYESSNYQNNWSGSKYADGTYFYELTVPQSDNVLASLDPMREHHIKVKKDTDKVIFAGFFMIIK